VKATVCSGNDAHNLKLSALSYQLSANAPYAPTFLLTADG
jgi:hypothetical protein